MCVCVFAYREKQKELSVFALYCGELSIVPGAESGLLLPHLKEGGIHLISRQEEKRKQRRREETKRSS